MNLRGILTHFALLTLSLALLLPPFESALGQWSVPDELRAQVSVLSDEEREALLKACRESTNSYLHSIVVLALSTGMRQGEIMNLRWQDVDLEKGRIVLLQTKNDLPRTVPLAGYALELLKEHSRVRRLDSDLLFPGKNPKKPVFIRAPWVKAVKEAGLSNFRFHDLRHCSASFFAENGATLIEIAHVLGHKTLAMTQRYSHLTQAHTAPTRKSQALFF